ncbi:MAG: YdbH domain-containing protein [Hyphomonadaceae bacterium]
MVALAAGLWFLRIPIAAAFLEGELGKRGVESDFTVTRLDFGGASIAAIRLGPETEPSLAIAALDVDFAWNGLSPRLAAINLVEPRLRVAIDPTGRVSAGALDNFARGEGGAGRRPSIPRIRLDVTDGQALIQAPFGVLTAELQASGVVGRDFSALANIAETSLPGEAYGIDALAAELRAESRGDALGLNLSVRAQRLAWARTVITSAALEANASVPLDLARIEAAVTLALDNLRAPDGSAVQALEARSAGEAALADQGMALAQWSAELGAQTALAGTGSALLQGATLTAAAQGEGQQGQANWSFTANRFAGFDLISETPTGEGALSFDLSSDERLSAEALLSLRRSALSADAQQAIRDAFPNLSGAPVGPTFTAAEAAFDDAADRFDLTVPIAFAATDAGARLRVAAPIEARAATGLTARLTPLRDDAPSVAMQWPGPSLGGAVAIDIEGGGAPRAQMLLDVVTWADGAPFEADGTVSISDWRAAGASIGTDEIGVRLIVPPEGGGRLELDGPVAITGPVGDGEIRDLVAELDIAALWGDGWRVTPTNGCLPIRLGGLDVAGLSFTAGALRMCAVNDVFVAADRGNRLSGGFAIEGLQLGGRMAGPEGQPARVGAARVTGAFGGTTDETLLAIVAATPTVAVDMAADRTIAFQGQSLTADTRIANGTWRTEGAFASGVLDDPGLPGVVSAIAGRWSASPEEDGVVISVDAGAADVVARDAPQDAADQRPLFNPIRLANVNGELRGGEINARGQILLDAGGRVLADFTAEHDTRAGEGGAHIRADRVLFGPDLQPFEISEMLRGVAENVSGPAGVDADVVWTPEALRATGSVRPQGVSLSTSTIPIVRDVYGEVYFDDLFAMTTPPGQELTIGELNPGIAIYGGETRFQLLANQRVSLESARFQFAGGMLAVDPAVITLGADETRFRLTLANVDVAALVTQLNMPDLHATGRVEGAFPILLTARTALIENGELRAAPGGGTISYVGQAGESMEGASRVAFDALRNFRYERLRLTLSGDISGDVVTSIEFTGENSGEPVDLSPLAGSLPGVGDINVRGVPFRFNVAITAPFSRLARTAAGITNPGGLVGEAIGGEAEENTDQTPPSVDVQVEPLR